MINYIKNNKDFFYSVVKLDPDAKDEPKFIKGETPLTDIPVFAHVQDHLLLPGIKRDSIQGPIDPHENDGYDWEPLSANPPDSLSEHLCEVAIAEENERERASNTDDPTWLTLTRQSMDQINNIQANSISKEEKDKIRDQLREARKKLKSQLQKLGDEVKEEEQKKIKQITAKILELNTNLMRGIHPMEKILNLNLLY